MKASEAIREGLKVAKEERWIYIGTASAQPCGCALGLAAIGKFGYQKAQLEFFTSDGIPEHALGQMLDLPDEVADEISRRHHAGMESAADLANWLESQGY